MLKRFKSNSSLTWWNSLFLAGLFCAVTSACTSPHEAEILDPPDMLDQLANADLSASRPSSRGSGQVEYASNSAWGSEAELYPGSDEVVREKKRRAARGEGVSRVQNGYQLNFNDAELSEVAKVILRDTLGIPYIYNPRVQGRVTVSTGGPVSRRDLLSVLESVLEMNRGALVVEENLYRIVPGAEARKAAPISVDYAEEAREVGPGYGVSIVPLKYVSSKTMMRMLVSLASKQDRPKAIVDNNLLIVRGTGQQRESLLEIVYMFDVEWMRGQSAGIFTLENSTPEEVIIELKKVFQADSQGAGLIRYQAINRLNAVLVLTQKSELLDKVDLWVSRLDRGGPEAENYFVYRVENGRANDLAELLTAAFGGGGGIVRRAEEAEVTPTEPAYEIATEGAAPGDEAASLVTGSTTPGAGATSSGVLIIPDERNNKLLIKASGRDLRKILGILRSIDTPPLQVLINATLAEVRLNDNLEYGVQFFLQQNQGKTGTLGFSNGSQIGIAPSAPGLNFIVGSLVNNPRIILDALAKETSVRIVSSPSVVALHNRPATLTVGDEVPFASRSAVSVISPDAPVVNEIEYKKTGVILTVTPRINSNGLVTMEIEQEISAVARTSTGDTLTPTINQRKIATTIAVQSGQMVVLGGLISEGLEYEKSSIPVLGKIPYLGDILGGNTLKTKVRTELVIFLQPLVIRDPQDASRAAEEVRARLQSLAPRPAAWDVQVEDPMAETFNGKFKK